MKIPLRRDGDRTVLEFVGGDARAVAIVETPDEVLAMHFGPSGDRS